MIFGFTYESNSILYSPTSTNHSISFVYHFFNFFKRFEIRIPTIKYSTIVHGLAQTYSKLDHHKEPKNEIHIILNFTSHQKLKRKSRLLLHEMNKSLRTQDQIIHSQEDLGSHLQV
ncbi:hypothetical protein ACTFIZ_007917 [Dictyostelium cf. discoideum]